VIHAQILAGLQKELQNKYEISSTIRHKGERGRKREGGVADFLKDNLPEGYGVATGEVFSFNVEGVSPQCDVIVYDRINTPVFGKCDSVQQVPIEGVYTIVEVRSIIDANALADAHDKFQAIRRLWTSSLSDGKRHDPKETGPSYILFGFKRAASEDACLRFLSKSYSEDYDLFALDSGCSVWVGPDDLSVPAKVDWLNTTAPKAGIYATLAFFYFGVLQSCQADSSRLNIRNILLSCL